MFYKSELVKYITVSNIAIVSNLNFRPKNMFLKNAPRKNPKIEVPNIQLYLEVIQFSLEIISIKFIYSGFENVI